MTLAAITVKHAPANADQRDNIRRVLTAVGKLTAHYTAPERVRYLTAAVMCVTQEAEARTDPTPDTYGSIGLFQQQASWGTVGERMSPEHSAGAWFRSFHPVHEKYRGTGKTLGWQIDEAQRSFTWNTSKQGAYYDQWRREAARTVNAWRAEEKGR